MAERPFRAPHQPRSARWRWSAAKARPGEISLAHNGVLFLDELPGTTGGALEALRQPLEDGFCQRRPRQAQAKYPARAMFVAAMNPCPCGNYGSSTQPLPLRTRRKSRAIWGASPGRCWTESTCSSRSRPSPCARSPRVRRRSPPKRFHARVQAARRRQQARYAGAGVSSNAELSARQLEQFCPLDDACREADRQGLRQIQPLHARGQPGARGRADNRRPRGEEEHRQGAYSGSAAVSQSGRKLLEVKGKRNA